MGRNAKFLKKVCKLDAVPMTKKLKSMLFFRSRKIALSVHLSETTNPLYLSLRLLNRRRRPA
jgi:hypothetical protein